MKVTALQIRQSLGKILKKLKSGGDPIIIEKGRAPVAVLISLEAYQERFIDYQDKARQEQFLSAVRETGVTTPGDSLNVLRELRYGKGD